MHDIHTRLETAPTTDYSDRLLVLCHSDSDMWVQAPMDSQFDLSKPV